MYCWAYLGVLTPLLWRHLLHKAIGDQLTCVFVDNGLLRKNEGDMVMEMFRRIIWVKVIRANAQDQFLDGLKA